MDPPLMRLRSMGFRSQEDDDALLSTYPQSPNQYLNQGSLNNGLQEDFEMQIDGQDRQLQGSIHVNTSVEAYPLDQNQELSNHGLKANSRIVEEAPAQEHPQFPLPITSVEAYNLARCLVSYEPAVNINERPVLKARHLKLPNYCYPSGNSLWDILKRGGYIGFATNLVKLNCVQLTKERIDDAWRKMVHGKHLLWKEDCGMDQVEWEKLAMELSNECSTPENERWWLAEEADENGIFGKNMKKKIRINRMRLIKEKKDKRFPMKMEREETAKNNKLLKMEKAERAKENNVLREQTKKTKRQVKRQRKAARRNEKRMLLSKEDNDDELLLKVEEKTTVKVERRLKIKQLRKQNAEKSGMESGMEKRMKKRERRKKTQSTQKNVSASEENLRAVKELQSMEEENGEQALVSMFSGLKFLPGPKGVAEGSINIREEHTCS